MDDRHLIVVHTFNDRLEAEMAKSALEAAGIDSMMRPDDVGGLRPHMAYTRGVEILVRPEDEGAARDIIDLPAKPA
jgi:Putative prokaryotic signal transducing protein